MDETLWAAGFFDGEGHASATRNGYPQFMICQRHREPLERFRDAVGVGTIYETSLRGTPLYHYCAASIASAARVSALIGPHLCTIKARQVDEMWRRFRVMREVVTVAYSPEHRAKQSAQRKGHTVTLETRAKISAALSGVPKSDAHCAAIKASWAARRAS